VVCFESTDDLVKPAGEGAGRRMPWDGAPNLRHWRTVIGASAPTAATPPQSTGAGTAGTSTPCRQHAGEQGSDPYHRMDGALIHYYAALCAGNLVEPVGWTVP